MKEYSRIEMNVQDQAARTWTNPTAARQTTLERLEEREHRRTNPLTAEAYDRYYAIRYFTAELGIAYAHPRPSADATLEAYIEECNALLEALAFDLADHDRAIIRKVIATIGHEVAELEDRMLGYRMRGVVVPTPSAEAPLSLPEARAWLNSWHEALEAAERAEGELLEKIERERRRLKSFLDGLTWKCTWRPEQGREEAEGIGEFWRRGILDASELREAEERIEVILEPVRRREAWQLQCAEREAAEARAEVERYARIRKQARLDSARRPTPLIPALRQGRREKRLNKIFEMKISSHTCHNGGGAKARAKRPSRSKSGHSGLQDDPRRQWRREHRKLVGKR